MDGLTPGILLAALAFVGLIYGGRAVVRVAEKPVRVITQPVRHPVRDIKALGHVFEGRSAQNSNPKK